MSLGLCSVGKVRLRGELIALCNFLRMESGERGASFFCLVTTDGMCRNGTKLLGELQTGQ